MNVPKAMMAEFSYFLEKYFGITSIIWTIIFISFCLAMIVGSVIWFLSKKHFLLIFSVVTVALSFMISGLIMSPETWCSKLHRVESNFNYIMSFDKNNDAFYNGLKIPKNEANKNDLFNIAEHLNDEQWEDILTTAGGEKWYFAKVHKAIRDILRVGEVHISLWVMYQPSFQTFLPIIFIFLISAFLFCKKKIKNGIFVFLSALFGLVLPFGGTVFMLGMFVFGYMTEWLLKKGNWEEIAEKFKKKI